MAGSSGRDGLTAVNDLLTAQGRGFGTRVTIAKAAIAATLAYVIAIWIGPVELAVFAPLVALFTVQSSAYATLAQGLQRVIGTVLGRAARDDLARGRGNHVVVGGRHRRDRGGGGPAAAALVRRAGADPHRDAARAAPGCRDPRLPLLAGDRCCARRRGRHRGRAADPRTTAGEAGAGRSARVVRLAGLVAHGHGSRGGAAGASPAAPEPGMRSCCVRATSTTSRPRVGRPWPMPARASRSTRAARKARQDVDSLTLTERWLVRLDARDPGARGHVDDMYDREHRSPRLPRETLSRLLVALGALLEQRSGGARRLGRLGGVGARAVAGRRRRGRDAVEGRDPVGQRLDARPARPAPAGDRRPRARPRHGRRRSRPRGPHPLTRCVTSAGGGVTARRRRVTPPFALSRPSRGRSPGSDVGPSVAR